MEENNFRVVRGGRDQYVAQNNERYAQNLEGMKRFQDTWDNRTAEIQAEEDEAYFRKLTEDGKGGDNITSLKTKVSL